METELFENNIFVLLQKMLAIVFNAHCIYLYTSQIQISLFPSVALLDKSTNEENYGLKWNPFENLITIPTKINFSS